MDRGSVHALSLSLSLSLSVFVEDLVSSLLRQKVLSELSKVIKTHWLWRFWNTVTSHHAGAPGSGLG
jgi:hypothetical protein